MGVLLFLFFFFSRVIQIQDKGFSTWGFFFVGVLGDPRGELEGIFRTGFFFFFCFLSGSKWVRWSPQSTSAQESKF